MCDCNVITTKYVIKHYNNNNHNIFFMTWIHENEKKGSEWWHSKLGRKYFSLIYTKRWEDFFLLLIHCIYTSHNINCISFDNLCVCFFFVHSILLIEVFTEYFIDFCERGNGTGYLSIWSKFWYYLQNISSNNIRFSKITIWKFSQNTFKRWRHRSTKKHYNVWVSFWRKIINSFIQLFNLLQQDTNYRKMAEGRKTSRNQEVIIRVQMQCLFHLLFFLLSHQFYPVLLNNLML